MVTHCFIDGHSRLVTGIRVSNNNRAHTVLDLFLEATSSHGVPSRVRGDHGTENLRVAECMEDRRGVERGSYIWGRYVTYLTWAIQCHYILYRSVHNTRIERLWYDVTNGYGRKWKSFFHDLEINHELDPSQPPHIWLLHYLFLECVNEDAQQWAEAWNAHKMEIRGCGNQSPREMFTFGMVRAGPRGIQQFLNAPEVEHVDDIDSYGVDWDTHDDPVLMTHFLNNNDTPSTVSDVPFGPANTPHRLSDVKCDPPGCPFTPGQVQMLNSVLSQRVDVQSRNMQTRRALWKEAFAICTTIV